MLGKLDPEERVLTEKVDLGQEPMQLTPELIAEINCAMAHTKKDGTYNWLPTDEYEVQIAGTFAADRFIVIKNKTKNPVVSAKPHPYFDYEKKVFTKDGREEYMKEFKINKDKDKKEDGDKR